jgi:CDP-diacylglycerol--serine O-phosphatidyltransferase
VRLRDTLIDPHSPDRRPRRAAYALPTLFTAGNIFLGFYAILKVFEGAMATALGQADSARHFQQAAMAIGGAVFFDGLDGRIARMTHTVSEFGRELDSLADVITFGIAPAALGFAWGVYFVPTVNFFTIDQLRRAGYFLSFLFLLCGAARLARFNIQKNPIPKNPGRPDRKYFVGLPIPAAAGMLASIIYATDGGPLTSWVFSVAWLVLIGLLSFLMVSTWRYPSFKDLHLMRPRSTLILVLLGSFIFLMFYASQPLLLGIMATYVGSGIAIRIGGIVRRRFRPSPPREPEHQVG